MIGLASRASGWAPWSGGRQDGRVLRVRRDDDHREPGRHLPEHGGELEPRHERQVEVGDDEIPALGSRQRKCGSGVGDVGYIEPTPPCQHVRAEEGEFWIVLYEEHPPS